jgi:hypothetical protein
MQEPNPLRKGHNTERLSNMEVESRAAEAQALLNNPIFQMAMSDAYSEAIGTLLDADVGSLTATTAHATMKAITAIRSRLEQFTTDHKMRQKYSKMGND